jgi:signal transduction histidine kinase
MTAAVAIEVAAIEISLSSPDPELRKLLREVLAEIRDPQCTLTPAKPEETPPDADLWVWDYEPGKPLPIKAGFRPSRHLFLVNPRDLVEFRAALAPAETNILLKPVTRNTLRATLTLAVSAQRERVSTATSLREERDDLLQCLVQTSLHLQDYDHERTAFLARAVHDFRAPLTAVNGYCGLLLGEHLGSVNEMQKEVLQRMQHSARRLSRMTTAMFELSVGRYVKRSPNLLQNDIRECLDQALHEILTFAEEKQIAITTDLALCDFPLYFEAGQIEQVLINILDNACKFTPRAGTVEVMGYAYFWERRAARPAAPPAEQRRHVNLNEPNCYRIDIQDSGAPIPSEHLNRIFEEYTSYDGGGDRSGGGLGLAIARMIMAQHGGRIWADNTAFGPRFSFVLPKRHAVDDKPYHI